MADATPLPERRRRRPVHVPGEKWQTIAVPMCNSKYVVHRFIGGPVVIDASQIPIRDNPGKAVQEFLRRDALGECSVLDVPEHWNALKGSLNQLLQVHRESISRAKDCS